MSNIETKQEVPQRSAFRRLTWKPDRLILDDIVFRLEDYCDDSWELGDECFRIYKCKRMFDQYDRFWSTLPDFRPSRMMEIGIFNCGSIAFWNEHFRPDKLVAIDLASSNEGGYYHKYVSSRGLKDVLKTYWKTSQADVGK